MMTVRNRLSKKKQCFVERVSFRQSCAIDKLCFRPGAIRLAAKLAKGFALG